MYLILLYKKKKSGIWSLYIQYIDYLIINTSPATSLKFGICLFQRNAQALLWVIVHHPQKFKNLLLMFVTLLFQGPKLEPLKEDTLASTYKSVSLKAE